MSTTISFLGIEYALRKPGLFEAMRFQALYDTLTGQEAIAHWLAVFATLCDDCNAPLVGTIDDVGAGVAEWLVQQHPEATVADLYRVASACRDYMASATSAPASALFAQDPVTLGNGSAGPLTVKPSSGQPGTPVSGSDLLSPSSAP